jgi:hypothetical protein
MDHYKIIPYLIHIKFHMLLVNNVFYYLKLHIRRMGKQKFVRLNKNLLNLEILKLKYLY